MGVELIGIDLAKNVFHLHGTDRFGHEVMKKRVFRDGLLAELSNRHQCRVVMEACAGSNYWSRRTSELGHEVSSIAPQYVKPYVQRNKNDWKDAEAIGVAARQPHMKYVPRRSIEQQDLQNLHRIRERMVKAGTDESLTRLEDFYLVPAS